jgi:hypothetical protein
MARTKSTLPGGTRVSDFVSLGALAKCFPAEQVSRAVVAAGRSGVRKRSLPPFLTLTYVMALWLFRDVSYEEVLDCLLESWRWLKLPGGSGATKGAITQARDRLGAEPLRLLFEETAVPIATPKTKGAWYGSWRLVAMDGTLIDTPDTLANGNEFGFATNQEGKGGFPKVRLFAIVECGTHAPFACAIGSYTTSETTLARQMKHKLNSEMLLLADRYYFGVEMWAEFIETGAALVWRLRGDAPVKIQKRMSDGSYLGKIHSNRQGELLVRVIRYQETSTGMIASLVTNILDIGKAPAIELAKLYAQRWEIELAFDEIKSHISETRLAVRSKKPELVRQELWALMLLHWAIRELMHEAALAHNRDPDELSFTRTVRLVKLIFAKDGDFSPS